MVSKHNQLRIGIIGCGAIAEAAYLPVFEKFKKGRLTCLIDADESRAVSLAGKFELDYAGDDLSVLEKYVDAVIVAVPNHLHFPIAKACLAAGKHVLCEKPMTINSESSTQLVEHAKNNNVKLAVAHVRRFYPSSQSLHRIIKAGRLGKVIEVECQEGLVFSWPTSSGFFFDKDKAGGGVLMDIGVHLFDLILWWFGSDIEMLEYQDDNLGGVEAFSKIRIRIGDAVNGTVTLSRLSPLRNSYRIKCENGVIEYSPFDMQKYYFYDSRSKSDRQTVRAEKGKFAFTNAVNLMLEDFCAAIYENTDPMVDGQSALKVIEFIQQCYENRQQIEMSWL